MFKNQNTFSNNAQNIQHQDLSQEKDLKIEDIPIHTMAKDIEEIEHPEKQMPAKTEVLVASKNITEKQKSSPFLAATVPSSQPKKPESSFFGSLFGSSPEKKIAQKNTPVIVKQVTQGIDEKKLFEQKSEEQRTIETNRLAPTEKATEKLSMQKTEEKRPAETPKPAEQRPAEIQRSAPQENKLLPQKNQSAIPVFIIAISIVLIIGAGIYYFLSTRQEIIVVEPTPEPEILSTPEPEVVIMPKLSFSSDKPNYLSIDTNATDNTQTKEAINKYIADIKASAVMTPVEFIATDLQNNPIDFVAFSQKLGLTLSKNVLSSLDKNFSLFIVNDNGNMRIGLAIDFLNSTKLQTALLKEEPILAKNLSEILLSTTFELSKTAFGKSEYNGTAIRYQNITSPETLSIDYALTDKQLLIGTTKMTLRSIIDKLMPATPQVVQTQDAAPTENSTTPTKNSVQPVDNLSKD